MAKASYCIRIDKTLLDKIGYIAKVESRSANREIVWIIKRYIRDYEKQNGKIEELNNEK